MEVFLHCNVCGHSPFPTGVCEERRYFITNCGHVACINCCGNWKEKCGTCSAPCKYVEINKDASPDVKAYFVDSMSAFGDAMKKFHNIFGFHMAQTKRNYMRLLSRFHSVAETEALKKENEKLRNEVVEHQRQLELLKQELQQRIGIGRTSFHLDQNTTNSTSLATLFGSENNGREQNFAKKTPFSIRMDKNTPLFGDGLSPRMNPLGNVGERRVPYGAHLTPPTRRSPAFCATPGAGRPSRQEQRQPPPTPDIFTRIRLMRSSCETPMGDTHNGQQFRR